MSTESEDLGSSCVRMLSEGSFDAQCCRCLKFSPPVNAIGLEHAWNELLKQGWTFHTSAVRGSGRASCLACLREFAAEPTRASFP
jgi:hypothetical protein